MKKSFIAYMLITVLVLTMFCACGAEKDEPAAPAAAPAGVQSVLPGQDLKDAPETTAEKEATTSAEENKYIFKEYEEIAARLIEQPVSKMYDKLGEPLSSEYAPSCLGSGEDGIYKYEFITVQTYKANAAVENVVNVTINENGTEVFFPKDK